MRVRNECNTLTEEKDLFRSELCDLRRSFDLFTRHVHRDAVHHLSLRNENEIPDTITKPTANGTATSCCAYFERTRTPLTSFIHSSRFSMMFFSSTMLKPVSFCSWSTYVNAGLPLFLAPCFGSQSSRSLITSSFFLQQCPINRSLLIISVSVILGRLPYRSLLVLCSFQETPRTALSIFVYVPSSLFLIFPVIVQHSAP